MLLSRYAYVVHGHKWIERVLADRTLGVKQKTISSIDDSSMDIWNFSSQRERIKDHWVKELTCENDRLGLIVAELDDILLDPTDLLNRQYCTELASWHKDCVTNV